MFKSYKKKKSSAPVKALDVALIGCGPAGMMFLHALNEKKKNADPKFPLPNVTCYEMAASPGGVWKDVPANDPHRNDEENKALMYDDLWINTPKELVESYDYTFDEHFKKATPTFLPRKDILDYLIARNNQDGVLDSVKFNHEVVDIKYNETETKFTLKTTHCVSEEQSVAVFDRVVFAGGVQTEPYAAEEVMDLLKDFKGTVMHSAEATENFEETVKDKTIMMVGDGSSAEDLCLRAIKLGANKIYVTARRGLGECAETGAWPENKVEVLYSLPYKVVEKGTVLKCQPMYWSEKRQKWRRDDEEEVVKVRNVDVVILCTGYDYDFDIFEEDYRLDCEEKWEISKGWRMGNNSLTASLGNITPNKSLWTGSMYQATYNCMLIKNPNIFYHIEPPNTFSPILELDVQSWLILSYLTGENSIPSAKDMAKTNQKALEEEMQIPYSRISMDYEYFAEMDEIDENHWSENAADERVIYLEKQEKEYLARRLARDMKSAKYPINFGKTDKLNDLGEKYVALCIQSERTRSILNAASSDSARKTYRDVDNPNDFKSLHTSTPSCPLPRKWLDLTKDPDAPAKLENYH